MKVMASAFGDQSYPKLPPIRKGSEKETQTSETGDQTNADHRSSFNRETHGLVRLPPIIRVDPSAPSPDLTVRYFHDHRDNYTENITENVSIDNSSSNISSRSSNKAKNEEYAKNTDSRHKELGGRTEQSVKRHITKEPTSNYNTVATDLDLDENDIRRPSSSHFEIDKMYGLSRRGSKPASLLTTQSDYKRRRGSLIVSEPEKLHRGRRLAKSSPNLSSTRKRYGSPVKETKRHADKTHTSSDPGAFHSITRDFVEIADHGNSNLSKGGKVKVANRNLTQRQGLKSKDECSSQPQSSPCTPILHLVNDENYPNSAPREFRKSLGDIYGSVGATRERRISINTRKKTPGKEENEIDSLFVKGKTCQQNERSTPRVSSPRPPLMNKDSFLKVPQSQGKRDSLYDLQQILSLLSLEKTDSKQVPCSSVYDLREFLEMSRSATDSISATATENAKQEDEGNTAKTLGVENPKPRRGSTYDLMEFLSLNASAIKKVGKEQGKAEVPSTQFLFPGPNEIGTATGDMRRSSAYDLMEFLSLTRQNEDIVKTDSNQSKPNTLKPAISLTIPSSGSNQEHPRKGSTYDLEEFLNLTRKNVPTMPEAGDTASANPLLSPRLPARFKFKRESIYDLQEFLGILQKESDLKRLPSNSTEKESTKDDSPTEHIDRNLFKQNSGDLDISKVPCEEPRNNRSLSIYDLREFLSLYAAQSQPNVAGQLRRKPSQISQSSIMINVSEDEYGNGSVDDVFLAVPVEAGRKRSSIASAAELSDLLNILNDTAIKKKTSNPTTPTPVSRHDSSGAKSLYDLGEFLSVLNSDDSPLRRRLSSVSDRGSRCPSSLSRNDSSGGSSLYDLEEFLAVLNDSGQGREGIEGDEGNANNEIVIPVPKLPPRIHGNGNSQVRPLNVSTSDCVNSVAETK